MTSTIDYLLDFSKMKKLLKPFMCILLVILLTSTVFVKEVSYLMYFLVFILTILLNINDSLLLYVFIYPFHFLTIYPTEYTPAYFKLIILSIILVKFIKSAIKKEIKVEWKVVLPLIILILYTQLPFHNINLFHTASYLVFALASFLFYTYREKINLTKFVIIFALAMIISGVLYFFKDYSEFLSIAPYYVYNVIRMRGCFAHANIYGFYSILTLGMLCLLFIQNKISIKIYLPLFISCFILGYLTLSRLFIASFAVMMIVFFIMIIKKYKWISFEFILPLTASLILIALIFQNATDCYIFRSTDPNDLEYIVTTPPSTTDLEKIWNNQAPIPCGRINIWRVYTKSLLLHPVTLLFGRGSVIRLGSIHAHNMIIHMIYVHGIVGITLACACFYFLLGGKELKNIKKYRNMILFILPLFIFQLGEVVSDISVFYWLFMYNFQSGKLDYNNEYPQMDYMIKQNTFKKMSNKPLKLNY